ncbi:MAG: undecaprenyl-diphosphate phosphatase [Nanoarchaeota archaeon]|nr:undecaprenyl-diphosphate phosphatase [Nanoarchaeota archaeon]
MNELLSSLIIAIVQGLTEWLPVSSSGHLVLAEKLLGVQNPSLFFDVALHFGTLMAVFVYFGSDIVDIVKDLISGKFSSENGRLGLLIIVATIPAALAGFFLKEIFEKVFNSLAITALGFGITGIFLIIASLSKERSHALNTKSAFVIGVAQIFALFPGISRSGSTLGSGLLFGLKEKQAIKFSFLMSIPIIFGANILVIGNNALPSNLIWATLVAFIVGLGTIHLLYGKILTSRKNLKWFGFYALALAIVLGIILII